MTIRAVIFDFDGLILDTESAEYRASVETFARYGSELTEDEFAEIVGSSWDAYTALRERATKPLPSKEEVRAAFNARTREIHETLTVLPGVETWIADVLAAGLGIAIASTSSEEWVSGHLHRLGLRDRFPILSCCGLGQVMPAKPAPDCYVAACDALGVAPDQALAVEDSANGVAAAKAAGLWCVAVPNPLTKRLDFSAADLRLASLTQATLAEVIATLPAPD
jgi:HAD superfamily hydrolase (TIGR01509 family)